jgi:hypothetical protein
MPYYHTLTKFEHTNLVNVGINHSQNQRKLEQELDCNLTKDKQRGINHNQRFASQKFIASGAVLLLTCDMVEDWEGRTLP